ncbi:MAG: thiamine phosphate synthase [Gammaproteobacteria bacterium]
MSAYSRTLRGLYAITDSQLTPEEKLLPAVEAVIRGGACLVQYRDKSNEKARRERETRALLQLCHDHDVPLIINDDVNLAAVIGADGVHLGRDDTSFQEARVQLGPRAVIGVSCYGSLEQAVDAVHAGADYVAFGNFFLSPTKPEAVSASLSILREARQQLNVPTCAIGGITPDNGGIVINAGADMLAAISGLFAQDDIEAAARRYARLFQ